MSNETLVSYLKNVEDLYPDGIPLRIESNPGVFIVKEGELQDSSKHSLLVNIVAKGMKAHVGVDVVFMEASEWSKKSAPFVLVFGDVPFYSLRLEPGSEALIDKVQAFRTYSLDQISSDEDKKRSFWIQLKRIMSTL